MGRDPRSMEPDEIVQEIRALKEGLTRSLARLVELSLALYGNVRRGQSDDYTSRYMAFANTWTRFSQMAESSLQRTASADRVIASIAQDKEDAERHSQQVQRKAKVAAKKSPTPTPTLTDLSELYGDEMVNNAPR